MKKLMALLLSLAMVFALVACDSDGGDGGSKKSGGGNYETPLELEMDFRNATSYKKAMDARIATLNGLCEKEIEGIYKLMGTDGAEESFEYQIENLEDTYGDDWEFSYEINDKTELDEDELEDLQDELQEEAEDSLDYLKEEAEANLEELMYYLDLDEDDAEKMLGYMETILEEVADIEITEGYELDVTYITSGSELEEDEEYDAVVYVYKVNGNWVSEDILDLLLSVSNF